MRHTAALYCSHGVDSQHAGLEQVKLLEKLERSIEQLVEGVPQAVFRQKLQPAELGRKLEREMLRQRQAGLGASIVPNRFDVELNPSDFEHIADYSSSLEDQMESWLAQVAHRKGCVFVSRVEVSLKSSEKAPKRDPKIVARFSDQHHSANSHAGHTAALPRSTPSGPITGSLVLLDGDQRGRSFIVPVGSTSIGRSPDNDIMLDHQDVSRRHARIDCTAAGLRVHDLGSTNGTRVNGENVSMADLAQNDVVQVGSLRMRVDIHGQRRTH